MYQYHGTVEQQTRVARQTCRCGSTGIVYSLAQLITNRRIKDPNNLGNTLTTSDIRRYVSDPFPPGSGYGKTYIFAVDESFAINVAPDHDRLDAQAVKHETLFHNAHVRAAGEIFIHDGIIRKINDHSGSYKTHGQLEANPDFSVAILASISGLALEFDDALHAELIAFQNG